MKEGKEKGIKEYREKCSTYKKEIADEFLKDRSSLCKYFDTIIVRKIIEVTARGMTAKLSSDDIKCLKDLLEIRNEIPIFNETKVVKKD